MCNKEVQSRLISLRTSVLIMPVRKDATGSSKSDVESEEICLRRTKNKIRSSLRLSFRNSKLLQRSKSEKDGSSSDGSNKSFIWKFLDAKTRDSADISGNKRFRAPSPPPLPGRPDLLVRVSHRHTRTDSQFRNAISTPYHSKQGQAPDFGGELTNALVGVGSCLFVSVQKSFLSDTNQPPLSSRTPRAPTMTANWKT